MFEQRLYGQDALSPAERSRLVVYEAKIPVIQTKLNGWYRSGELPMLQLPARQDDLAMLVPIADHIRTHSKRLLVLGTGGSSLGGQTLCALSESGFPVYFLDNLDPHTTEQFLVPDVLAESHLLIISKSGSTLETLTQALVFLHAMQEKIGHDAVAQRTHIITIPDDNPLRQLGAHYDVAVLDHDPKVGGRYSVLSLVGMLPAMVAGVEVSAIRAGAQSVLDTALGDVKAAALTGAVWQAALMPERPVSVLMPYCDRLRLFSFWYQQLWAESIGKQGKGSTPVAALGAVDQHSQLQLYLDGPRDKNFTLLTVPHQSTGAAVPAPPFDGFDYLTGQCVGDVIAALQHGTVETIKQHALPLRIMALETVDESTLGALLMHYMLETIATAELLGINAFDQPAVEDSKRIARDTLRQWVRVAA